MTSPLKKKKSVMASIDANSLVDEVVQSIVKIKKQKQRPNSERIHAMILKSHPDLSVHFIDKSIELAIKEGLVVNHLHNGIYSYRVAIGNASQLSDKIIDDKSIEDAVKSLFYESEHQYSIDKLEVLVKCKFPQGSHFNSNLNVVIRNTCAELVERGRISHLKNLYKRKNVEDIQEAIEQPIINQTIEERFLKTEPFKALKNSPVAHTSKNETVEKKYSSNIQDDTDLLYKDSKSDLKLECKSFSLKRTHDILDHNFSDDSNDKPKRRKTRSLQLSFLYDSLSSFFSVTSCKRSCTIKKPSYNMDEYSNDSIITSNSVKASPKFPMKKNNQIKKHRNSIVDKIENIQLKQIKTPNSKPKFESKLNTNLKVKNTKKKSTKIMPTTFQDSSQLKTQKSLNSSKVFHHTDNHFSSDTESLSDNDEKNSHKLVEAIVTETDEQFFKNLYPSINKGILDKGKKLEIAFGRYLLSTPNMHLVNPLHIKNGRLVMCEFCLETLDTNRCLERHLLKCGRHSPPGVEIYRDNDLKLFHLNHKNIVYCNLLERLLQLLFVVDPQHIANHPFSLSNQNNSFHQQSNYKTYLSGDHSESNSNEEENEYNDPVLKNKTSHHITTNTKHHQLKTSNRSLNYFLLTIQDRSGSHLAGVLSYGTTKTSMNIWNVSCLFILPQYRNQGHAKYLVNLAYNIAALQELKGTHLRLRIPLKDHVANVFLSVWCHIIVQFFIHSKQCQFSIQDISIGTGIQDKDIITALNSLKLESDFYLNDQMVDMTQGQKEELRQRVVVSKSYTDASITFNAKLARNHTKLRSTVESTDFNCKKSCSNVEKVSLTDTAISDCLMKSMNGSNVSNLCGSFNSSYNSNSSSSPIKKEKNKRNSHDLSEIITKLSNQQNCKLMMAASAPDGANVECYKNNEIKNNSNEPSKHCVSSNDSHRSIEKVSKNVTEREINCLTDNLDRKYSTSSENLKELNKTQKSEKNSSFDEKVTRDGSAKHATAVNQSASASSHMPCLNTSGIKTSPNSNSYNTFTNVPHFTPSSFSSPSPPDLKKELSRFGVASSVRSDVSEVDVGGPGSSPLKSPCKDIPSQASSLDVPLRSEDEECKVVSVENAFSQSHLSSSSINSANGRDANEGFSSKSLKNNQIIHNDKTYKCSDYSVSINNKKDDMKYTPANERSCDGLVTMADEVNSDRQMSDQNEKFSGNNHIFQKNKDNESSLRNVDNDVDDNLNTANKKVDDTNETSCSESFNSKFNNCLHTKINDFSGNANNDKNDHLNNYNNFENIKNSSVLFGKDSQNMNTSGFNINNTSNNNDSVLRRHNENVCHGKNDDHKNDTVVQKNFYNNLKNDNYNNNFNKNHNNNLNVSVNNMSHKTNLMNSFHNNNNKGKINYESALSQRKKSEMQSESKYSVISPHPSNININEEYMQERCNSVFGDYYSYLPHPQGTHRTMSDKRLERPATRCGFEANSYPPHCSEFRYETETPKGNFSRSMAPPNDSYLNQLNNFPVSSQASNFNNRPQRLQAPGKASKRSTKFKNQSNSAYSSSVHATSASSFPLSPDQIFNPFYRFPNMAQNFDLANTSYLHEDLLMRNFMPSNSNSNNNESTNNNDNNNNNQVNTTNNSSRNTYFNQQRQQSPSSKHHSLLLPCQPQLQQQHLRQQTHKHSNIHSQHSSMNECRMENNTATSPIDQQQHGLLLQQQTQQHPAYLNPAAYFAKLHQFHSEFSQLQYPSFFSKASSPSPIDMSLHIPPGQRTNLPEAIKAGGQNLDLFPSYNLNPYSSNFDARALVHRNPHAQSSLFSPSQHSSILPNQLYSSYTNENNHS